MTDNEIIKALECCSNTRDCSFCEYYTVYCKGDINIPLKDALDLINRQKAEIERWEISHSQFISDINAYKEKLKTAKAEAVKEFAERFLKKVHDNHYLLSDRVNSKDYGMFTVGIEQAVNETKEEMAGEG